MIATDDTLVVVHGDVTFVWSGGYTVNVWRRTSDHGLVCFDMFTMETRTKDHAVIRARIANWYQQTALDGSDPRYTLVNPTKEQLLG